MQNFETEKKKKTSLRHSHLLYLYDFESSVNTNACLNLFQVQNHRFS